MSQKKTSTIQSNAKQNIAVPVKDMSISIPKWAPAAVIIFTALLYSKALQNGFVYLDDDVYILKNSYLRDFSLKGVVAIFSKFNVSNYHPFTTITNLFEYRFFGLDPLPYHLANVALHLFNTWLVFRLTERLSDKKVTALIVCILFAVHPLHVESVAWLSERKDVLYASFYLLSLLAYLRYLASGFSKKQYLYTLLLFLASLLSKSAAVTLPVLLIVIDIYKGRTIGVRSLIEKLPFILLSVFFGILTIMAQKAGGALGHLPDAFGFVNKIFLFTSRIAFYVIESVIPFRLCSLNCLPEVSGGMLAWYYYVTLPFVLILIWLIAKKNVLRKEIIFGFSFFMVTISVMLQVVNVGYALTAERYTYIPYIGLFYIVGQLISRIINRHRNYTFGIISIFMIVFSVLTYNRIGIWKDSDILFSDILKKNPGNRYDCYVFYFWGLFKRDEGNRQEALQDFSNAIELEPRYIEALNSRALLYDKMGDTKNALADLDKAISLNPKKAEYYNNRAVLYNEIGNKKAAILDYTQAIYIAPLFADAYYSRGLSYDNIGDTKNALTDFNKAISLNPQNAPYYSNRGFVYYETGNKKAAMSDYNLAIKIDPNYAEAYNNKGWAYYEAGDTQSALTDFDKAIASDPKFSRPYYNRAIINVSKGNFSASIEDYNSILVSHPNDAIAYYNRGMVYLDLKDQVKACSDLEKAMHLGYKEASVMLHQYCH